MSGGKTLLQTFSRAVDRLVDGTSAIAMVLQIVFMVLLAVQIVLRFVFHSPIFGIEEGVTAMVVWFACFGAVEVTRENGHAQVEYFLRFFSDRGKKVLMIFTNILMIAVSWFMLRGGISLFKVQRLAAPAGGLWFSKCYYYALPIIVMSILLMLVCLNRIIKVTVNQEGAREGGDII